MIRIPRTLHWIIVSLVLLAGGVLAWSVSEPFMLQVHHESITVEAVQTDTPLHIAHLSDLHWSKLYSSVLDNAVNYTLAERPDVIFLTGDFFHTTPLLPVDEFLDALRRLTAQCPVYACLGNHDDRTFPSRNPIPTGHTRATFIAEMLDSAGIHVLRNETAVIELRGIRTSILGIDTRPDLKKLREAIKQVDNAQLHLVIAHDPHEVKLIDYLVRRNSLRVDLLCCGHTHGGQLRVPFTGWNICDLLKIDHQYRLSHGDHYPINVNPGIVSLLRVRFNCPPEISLIEITGRTP